MRRSCLLLVLLLLPLSPAQSGPALDLEIVEHIFAYGPEDWKEDAASGGDQATLTTQVSNWNASLGLRLEVELQVTPRSGEAGAQWDYEAVLTDGVTEVPGKVTVLEAGRIHVMADVDGQRALPGMDRVPALLPGIWLLHVSATSGEAPEVRPEGSGQVPLAASGASFVSMAPAGEGPLRGVAVPEGLLPHMAEVGPGPNVWMPLASQSPGAFDVTVQASRPGQELRWVGYVAVSVLPSVQPGAETPVGPFLPGTSETAVQWVRSDFGTSTAGVDGLSTIRIGLRNITAELLIIAAYDDLEGGVAVAALGVSEERARIHRLQAPDPGTEGNLVVGFLDAGLDNGGVLPGTLYALRQGTPGNTGGDLDGSLLASAPVIRDSEETWRADLDTRAIRSAGIGAYTLLAFHSDAGRYGGHSGLVRGVSAHLEVPALGVGSPATVRGTMENIGGDGRSGVDPSLAFAALTNLTMDDKVVEGREVKVPEGGRLVLDHTVEPEREGQVEFVWRIDSGDILHEVRQTETVLDAQAFKESKQKWYSPERLTPGPSVAWLLLGLLAVGRKR